MALKKVKLLFIYDERTSQANIVNFLKSQVSTVKEAHSLTVNDQLSEINLVLIREPKSATALNEFVAKAKSLNSKISVIVIEKEIKISELKKSCANTIDTFVSLPLAKTIFMNALNSSAKRALSESQPLNLDILETVIQLQENCFFLLKKNELVLESPTLKKLIQQEDILKLFTEYQDSDFFHLHSLPEQKFQFLVQKTNHDVFDTLVTLEKVDVIDYDPISGSSILSREVFFDFLKEKTESLLAGDSFTLCDIQIMNHKELISKLGHTKTLELMHKLMHHTLNCVDGGKISFWHEKNFILTLDGDFEDNKAIISSLQKEISQSTSSKNIPSKVTISATPIISTDNIEHALQKLDSLLLGYSKGDEDIFIASSYDDIDDENQKIIAILRDILDDPSKFNELRFTSFYKGLVINSKISSASLNEEGELLADTDVIQCLAMSIENTVLLNSTLIPKDISCQVKQVNSRQKKAQVHDFTMLETSYKQRKSSRLVPAKNTAITLAIDKTTITGMVLDISLDSISLSVTNSLIANYGPKTELTASLNLVHYAAQRSETVRMQAHIINIIPENDSYKVILGFDKNDEVTGELLEEYLRLRKQELLLELKNLLKVT